MSNLIDAVQNYLKESDCDYAFMLTAPWGSGKSYFWREQMVKTIEDEKDSEGNRFATVYVSLYGIKNTREITDAILYPLLNAMTGTKAKRPSGLGTLVLSFGISAVGGAASEALKKAGIQFGDKDKQGALDVLTKTRPIAICFDDLERAVLPIPELLGFLNRFVEHSEAKVFIICNEDEIRSDNSQRKDYLRIKEKIVRTSYRLPAPNREAITAVVQSAASGEKFRDYLTQHFSLIEEYFRKSQCDNLRILKSAINALHICYCKLSAEKIDPCEKLLNALIPAAMAFYNKELNATQLESVIRTIPAGLLQFSETFDNHSPECMHYLKYYGQNLDIDLLRLPALTGAITLGVVDSNAFRDEICLAQTMDEQAENPLVKLSDNLAILEDIELEELFVAGVNKLRSTKMDMRIICGAISQMLTAADLRMVERTSQQVKEAIFDSLKASVSLFPIADDAAHWHAIKLKLRGHEDVLTRILKMSDAQAIQGVGEEFRQVCDDIEHNPQEFARFIADPESPAAHLPFSKLGGFDQVHDVVQKSSNKILAVFCSAIEARYAESAIDVHADYNFLLVLKGGVDFIIGSEFEQHWGVRWNNLNRLSKILAVILIELEPLQNQD